MAPSGPPAAKAKPEAKKEKVEKKKKVEPKEDPDEAKIPVIEQPDKKDFDAKNEQLQGKIDAAQAALKAVKDSIGSNSSGNSEFQSRRSELLEKVRAESAKIEEYMSKKDDIRAAMGLKTAEDKQLKTDLKDMKKKLGYTDLQAIDGRIAEIEDVMHHSSLTLKEEKKYMLEIAQLKKNKPEVNKFNKLDQEIATKQALNNNSTLKEQLDQINEVMNVHRGRKKELNEEFTALLGERDAQMGNSKDLYGERDKHNDDVRKLIQERNELRDSYRQQERNYYEYQKEVRNLRWEKQREERESREKEWQQEKRKREAEKLDDQPFVQETTLLEQTIKFCKTFQPKEAEKKEEVKAAVVEAKEGEMVLVDKKNREEEFYYAPTKKGKASKSKGKKEGGSAKPIKHNAETFKLFATLKIDAPITTDDIPATLVKLEAEMESYQGKIKDWEAKRDEMKAQILEKGYVDKDEEEKEEAKEEVAKEEEE